MQGEKGISLFFKKVKAETEKGGAWFKVKNEKDSRVVWGGVY